MLPNYFKKCFRPFDRSIFVIKRGENPTQFMFKNAIAIWTFKSHQESKVLHNFPQEYTDATRISNLGCNEEETLSIFPKHISRQFCFPTLSFQNRKKCCPVFPKNFLSLFYLSTCFVKRRGHAARVSPRVFEVHVCTCLVKQGGRPAQVSPRILWWPSRSNLGGGGEKLEITMPNVPKNLLRVVYFLIVISQ